MARDNRVTVRLGTWRPPRPYNQPRLEPDAGIRTVEHEVLAETSVIQDIGDKPEVFTLKGDAYADDLATLRDMRGETVSLRHDVHSGDVLVENVVGKSTGSYDEVNGVEEWIYTYTVSLIGVI